jgi:hypothetical protein
MYREWAARLSPCTISGRGVCGKLFHDEGRAKGYVLMLGGKRDYLSGDTECIDEMKVRTWY